MSRHRTKRRMSVGAAVVALLALAWVIVVAGPSDGERLEAGTVATPAPTGSGPVSSSGPAATGTPPAPTSAATTAIVDAVVDPADYVGRNHSQVVDDLRALGYIVTERRVETERGTKKDIVVAVWPNGQVPTGASIEVQVSQPAKGKTDNGD